MVLHGHVPNRGQILLLSWSSAVLRLLASANFPGLCRAVNTGLENKVEEETTSQLFIECFFFIFKASVCF